MSNLQPTNINAYHAELDEAKLELTKAQAKVDDLEAYIKDNDPDAQKPKKEETSKPEEAKAEAPKAEAVKPTKKPVAKPKQVPKEFLKPKSQNLVKKSQQ